MVCLVYYNIGTENGNSGSPVFIGDNNYTVQGVHVAGNRDAYAKRIDPLIYTLVNNLNSNEQE